MDILRPWLCDDGFIAMVREKNKLHRRLLKRKIERTDTNRERLAFLTAEVNR